MSALRRLFELIVLTSVGAFALCAGHVDSTRAGDRTFVSGQVCAALSLVGAVAQTRGRQGLR